MVLHIAAALISLQGEKWSGTSAILVLSKTGLPIFLNSLIAGGPVISLASTKSTCDTKRSPADTSGRPACLASIFSVIVIPIITASCIFYSIKLNKKPLPALMQTGAIINRGTTLIGASLCLTLLCVASYSVQKRGSRASLCCFAAAACTIRRFSLPVLTACSRSLPLIIT